MKGKLIFEDQTVFEGDSFGAEIPSAGEVVFTTAMTGYVESLTDPSYKGQILIFTYPLIGNYGIPSKNFWQSSKIQVSGVIVSQNCFTPNHHQSQKSLSFWLKENQIPALSNLDTRLLTQKIRQKGTLLGKIVFEEKDKIDFYNPNEENQVQKVSCPKPVFFNQKSSKTICLIDCGTKKAILDSLLELKVNVWRVPWNYTSIFKIKPDGLVISNGPGNPKMVPETIQIIKEALAKKIPILGICLGNQILALAAGGNTYKLKFGHRSANQPVKDLKTGKCFITSQNHGFAVETSSLPPNWQPWFINLNDQTCEGIASKDNLYWGVQFHPEGNPGPKDTSWIFEEFIKKI